MLYSLCAKAGTAVRRTLVFGALAFSVQCGTAQTLTHRSESPTRSDEKSAVTSDSLVARDLRAEGVTISDGNAVQLLMSGHEKFEVLFRKVRAARRFIHMEYFNFRNDSINSLLISLLAEKVREGLEVRVMYDDFGNWSNNQPIRRAQHDSIAALGINLRKFDALRFPWVNHIFPRDHRKIVVIDGEVAFTGGMNVADYYINGIEGIGPWRDLHMCIIHGPAVNALHRIFATMWEKETGERIEGERYFPRHDACGTPQPSERCGNSENVAGQNSGTTSQNSTTAGQNSATTSQSHDAGCPRDSDGVVTTHARLAIVDRAPKVSNRAIRHLYVSMLNNAQERVRIINPYFVPTHKVRRAIRRAIDRGVDVQILLSAKSDIPLTPDASHYVGYKLDKRGAKVYLFVAGFHHTKAMAVDDRFCTIGSSNLDSRSLRCDYEVNTVIFDRDVTAQFVQMFERDKGNAYPLDRAAWKQKTRWKRFVAWFGNLLTPFL